MEPLGVRDCMHPTYELLPKTLQPCGQICPSTGEATGCPWTSHHISVPRHAVSTSRLSKLLKLDATQLHKLLMLFPLVKQLLQPALLQRNAAPALALGLVMSHQYAHLLCLLYQLRNRLGPMQHCTDPATNLVTGHNWKSPFLLGKEVFLSRHTPQGTTVCLRQAPPQPRGKRVDVGPPSSDFPEVPLPLMAERDRRECSLVEWLRRGLWRGMEAVAGPLHCCCHCLH